MKTFFVGIAVILCCSLYASGQNANGCSSGMRNGVFYTDCWTDVGDDTSRLQSAVTAAAGSKLIFNESSYSVSNSITLASYSILEGTAPADSGTKSKITLTANSKSVFVIGEGIHAVTIRDLGFYTTNSTTVAIEAVGSSSSSQTFHFNNLWIKGFTMGIYAHATDTDYTWQFDDVHVDDSSFYECEYGIYLNSIDTGWQMNNLVFSSLSGQYGVYIVRSGYVSMNMLVGNAARSSGIPVAEEFIHIGQHGVISIQTTSAEWYKKQLKIDDGGTEKSWAPIYLINNGFPDCPYAAGGNDQNHTVSIKNSIVVSSGNDYACSDKDSGSGILTRGPSRPQILGTSDVISHGDRFCKWTSVWCLPHVDTVPNPDVPYDGSEFSLEGGVSTLNSSNMVNASDYSSPLLELMAGFSGKTLLRLGNSNQSGGVVYKKYHSFSVNDSDGWLEVEGSLDPPYSGYRFKKGPVQLAGTTQSSLSSFSSTSAAGSMLYCSNCTANTNPCSTSGGGGGALAIKVESGNWSCK